MSLPPPGWAGSDPATWQRPRRRPGLVVLVVVLVVLAVAGAAALVWAVVDAGGDDAEDLSPAEVVEEFFAILKDGDCDRLVDHLDTHLVRGEEERWRKGAEHLVTGCERMSRFSGLLGYEVLDEEVDGDRAVVTVEIGVDIPLAGEDQLPREKTQVELEEVDGVWMYVDAGALDSGL